MQDRPVLNRTQMPAWYPVCTVPAGTLLTSTKLAKPTQQFIAQVVLIGPAQDNFLKFLSNQMVFSVGLGSHMAMVICRSCCANALQQDDVSSDCSPLRTGVGGGSM